MNRRTFLMGTTAVTALLAFPLAAKAAAPIEIEELADQSESSLKYAAADHHADAPFRLALRKYLEPLIGQDDAREDAAELSIYRTWVKPRDDEYFGVFYEHAKPSDMGAVPMTETEWV